MSRKLIINADDYGHCLEVNVAIEELAVAGKLGGVSILANGNYFKQAVSFASSHPQLRAGVHLNAVEGQPVSRSPLVKILTEENGFFVSLAALLRRWLLHPFQMSIAMETEWRAQIEKLIKAGVKVTHADSHRHLHAFPPAYHCAVKLCLQYAIPALRWPSPENAAWAKRPGGFAALKSSLTLSRAFVRQAELAGNDHFLGFRGIYEKADLVAALKKLLPGVTELVLHPSIRDGYPYSGLNGNRQRHLALDEELPGILTALGVETISWDNVRDTHVCKQPD